ncbi:S8 family serine peptidase [Actinoplanes oblitus]|uniref:S8 family serine peptidase n=1 Tax=Actinoplanes oblitus TaxID=3040509 RepID=A0ABY8WH38_9ACTN|nr:S8 family serine peptidase [Actinoplanes oblitus]WIM97206.1 S8 family serine peptidase [Actinoplanes oblitus]
MNRKARRWTVGLLSAALITAAGGIAGTASAADTLPVRLLVGLKPGYDASARMATLAGLGLQGAEAQGHARSSLLSGLGAKSLSVPTAQVQSTLAALRRDPAVEFAQVDVQRHLSAVVTPNDTLYAQHHQPELGQIKVPDAWQTTTGSDRVTVAVVDSGVNQVGDLRDKLLPGFDFFNYDDDPTDTGSFPHGTVVASLIAGASNNGSGLAGVCWQCQILPVRVMGPDGSGYDSDIAQGVIYAVDNGAQIINLSLGGFENDPVLARAVAYANGRGVLVVAAAGNEDTTRRSYPAALPDVLAVGGTDTVQGGNNRVYFSNYSSSRDNWVDVAAPAITAGMLSKGRGTPWYCYNGTTDSRCLYRGKYMVRGTSFSSPLVAGVAGLIKSAHPEYSGWSLQQAITSSAVQSGIRWTRYGLVNAAAALTKGTDRTKPTLSGISPAQNARVHGSVPITPVGLKDNWAGIRGVQLYVNGRYHSWSYSGPSFAPKLNTAGKNGPISVQLKVWDKAGNYTWSGTRTVIADNIKPKLSVTSWPKNKKKVKGTVTVKAKASDASGISKVQLLVNGKVVATDYSAAYKLTFKVSKQKKTMKVKVRVYDRAGNYTTSSIRTYTRA